MTLSPTALESAAVAALVEMDDRGLLKDVGDDLFDEIKNAVAIVVIMAYLAQAGKEGWVMVPRADIVEVRESMEQMDGTFDPETSDYALYHRLDVLLHPELIGYAAAQNGGEPCK